MESVTSGGALRRGFLWALVAAGCTQGPDLGPGDGDPPAAGVVPDRPVQVETAEPVVAHDSEETGREDVAPDSVRRVIVGLRVPFVPEASLPDPASRDAQRGAVRRAQDAFLARDRASILHVNARYVTIPFVAVSTDSDGEARLRKDPAISSVVPDQVRHATLIDSAPLVGATQVWAQGATGGGAVVAILDTGVDKSHGFLAGRVVAEACFSTNDASASMTSVCPAGVHTSTAVDSGGPCPAVVDGCSHGTHVAGIAAGSGTTFGGIARDADIVAVQVFSKFTGYSCWPARSCVGSIDSDIVLALEHALLLQQGGLALASVNMSLGGDSLHANCDAESPAATAAIVGLRAAGVATVVSSGNDGYARELSFPACISAAISVGSTTKADEVDTSYSNSDVGLTLLAPGTDINSSIPGEKFEVASGTSMAAPHVAGAFALMKGVVPGLTVDEGLSALVSTGVPLLDSRNGVSTPRIQVDAAVATLGVIGVKPPVFSPPAGDYVGEQTVTLSSATDGAVIRYTTDGSTPTATHGTEIVSGAAIVVPVNETIIAVAIGPGSAVSAKRIAPYTLHGDAPVLNVADGEYGAAQTIGVVAPTPGTAIRYTIDGSTPTSSHGKSLASGGTFSAASTLTVRATATRAGWNDSPVVASQYVITGGLTVDLQPPAAASAGAMWRRRDQASDGFEDGTLGRFAYTTAGDAAWTITDVGARYGRYALHAPPLIEDQSASISATIECDGGSIVFSRRVSSEDNYDLLTFSVDGVTQGQWGGEDPWSTASFPVPPGEHTFTWTYSKDEVGTSGQDSAWIDEVRFPGDQWRRSGDTVRVTSGSQRLMFWPVTNWTTPAGVTVATSLGQATRAAGTYVQRTVEAPTFDPVPGLYTGVQRVALFTPTPDATIHFTVDGSAPSASSPVFSGPIPMATTGTVRAFAVAEGRVPSTEVSGTWTITGTVATPSMDPAPGVYLSAQTVSLSTTTPGAVLHYTLDGGEPDAGAPVYEGPIALSEGSTQTVRARAFLTDWAASGIVEGTYVASTPIVLDWKPGSAPQDDRLAAGATAALLVSGGTGPFVADPSVGDGGTSAVLTWSADRELSFLAPAVGGYAGTYSVTVTDSATASEASVDVAVAPVVSVDALALSDTRPTTRVTVRGAAPSATVTLALVDEGGNVLPAADFATLASAIVATNAPSDGDPATATLSAISSEVAHTFRVRATVEAIDGYSSPITVAAVTGRTGGGGGGGGCACGTGTPGAGGVGVLGLAGLLALRRRATPRLVVPR